MGRRGLYGIFVLLAGSSYGFVSPVLKIGYAHGLTVHAITSIQYVLAAAVLWLLVPFWPGKKRVSRRQFLLLVALGVVSAGTSFFYYQALTILDASVAIVLLFQFAWMVMLMDIFIKKRRPTPARWWGLVFILVGTVLAVGIHSKAWAVFPVIAVINGLGAALSYALTLYLSEYADKSVSPAVRSAMIMSLAFVFISFVFPPTYLFEKPHWSTLLLYGTGVSILSQVIPLFLMSIAIPYTGGRMAGVLATIELPVAVFSAWLILRESIDLWRWIGVFLILAGMVISEASRRPTKTNEVQVQSA